VYVISAEGGEPKRLTFHPGTTSSSAGLPTAKTFLRSDRFSAPRAVTPNSFSFPARRPREGAPGSSRELNHFFADGTKIAYLETSQEFRTWKPLPWRPGACHRHLRPQKEFLRELPKTAGMDLFPMWHGNTIYFIQRPRRRDEPFSYDLGSSKRKNLQTTRNTTSSAEPGPDAIVYENGGVLHEFNLASGKTRQICRIVVRAEDVEARPEFKSVAQSIGSYSLSPSRRVRWWRLAPISSRFPPSTAAYSNADHQSFRRFTN